MVLEDEKRWGNIKTQTTKLLTKKREGEECSKHWLGLLCLAQSKGRGANERESKRERENQSSFISCVLSEVRRTKREKVFWDEPLRYAEEWAMFGDNNCSAICISSWCVNKKKETEWEIQLTCFNVPQKDPSGASYTHTGWKKGK